MDLEAGRRRPGSAGAAAPRRGRSVAVRSAAQIGSPAVQRDASSVQPDAPREDGELQRDGRDAPRAVQLRWLSPAGADAAGLSYSLPLSSPVVDRNWERAERRN